MILKIHDILGKDILSGAINGKAAFSSFIALSSPEPMEPSALYLDFSRIEVATASFLRESVIAFKSYMRVVGGKYYPVVANINLDIEEELSVLMEAGNDAILSCNVDKNGQVSEVSIIGQLDPKQSMTFDLAAEMTEVDASSLMKKFGASEKTKSTTAWNNRLSALVSRGLLREFSRGRAKYYRPLLEEM